MKKIVGLFLLGTLLFAQNTNAQKYGYIDKSELYKSIPEYDSAAIKVENLRKEFETQLAGMQNDLSSKTASLNNESAGISDFLRKSRQDEIKNLDVRIQLFSVRANGLLQDKQNQLLQPIIVKAENAIKSVAEEQGFIFVIDGSLLLYTDEKKCTNMLPLVKAKLGVK
jgi:outer membrane protein